MTVNVQPDLFAIQTSSARVEMGTLVKLCVIMQDRFQELWTATVRLMTKKVSQSLQDCASTTAKDMAQRMT